MLQEFALPGIGSVGGFSGTRKSKEMFFSFTSELLVLPPVVIPFLRHKASWHKPAVCDVSWQGHARRAACPKLNFVVRQSATQAPSSACYASLAAVTRGHAQLGVPLVSCIHVDSGCV